MGDLTMDSELELSEDMTSEDIAALADALYTEDTSGGQGEGKSDAEIVTDTASVTPTSAEKNSGSKTVSEEVQDEDSGKSPKSTNWVDDKVKAEVAAYGIDESDLSEFASREELDRALKLIDKKAFEAGRKALGSDAEDSTRNEKGQFKKQEAKGSEQNNARYEVTLSKDLYDDEIVDEFTRLRDHYESRLEVLESKFADVSAKSEEERFDGFVDSLGHAELFGKTGSETQEELERRQDLHGAVKAQIIGLQALGRPVELTDKLVDRVAKMVFADELGKKLLKQHTQKVSRQNQLRQGGSPTKPQPPRDNDRDEADRLYRELAGINR